MITLQNLCLRRGEKVLFENANGTIFAGHKVGVIGENGCGKSSFLALIQNQLHADSGHIEIPQKLLIAHVKQETPALQQSALDYVLDGDGPLRELQQHIQNLTDNNAHDQLAEAYEKMHAINGYSAEARAGRLLYGLGFTAEEEKKAVAAFSGGWRMRLNLAQALMSPSDLLLLDEPTNHLDIEAVLWLEDWLNRYAGTLLIISHDRDFLDATVNRVVHFEAQQMHFYSGNFSTFENTRAAQLANQQASFVKQQQQIKHMQAYVERFRYKASKAKQAQSRLKALDRMEKISQAQIDSPFDFKFFPTSCKTQLMIQLDSVDLGYAEHTVLHDIKLRIEAGDRIGLLGQNGAGKSTLIKALCEQLLPQNGDISFAKNLNVGYFAQHQLDQLHPEMSALDHLKLASTDSAEQPLRDFLGGFAFHGDKINSSVNQFSGGEKARLVLALLVYKRPDILLLDEPTNHLDMKMRHAISVALQSYEGAVVLVSHDRHLLNTVSDRFVLVNQGKVSEFSGDLEDYRQHLLQVQQDINKQSREQANEQAEDQSNNNKNQSINRSLLKPLKNKIQKLEKMLEQLSSEKKRIEDMLSDQSLYDENNKEKLQLCIQQQQQNQIQLDQTESDWMHCSEQIEELS